MKEEVKLGGSGHIKLSEHKGLKPLPWPQQLDQALRRIQTLLKSCMLLSPEIGPEQAKIAVEQFGEELVALLCVMSQVAQTNFSINFEKKNLAQFFLDKKQIAQIAELEEEPHEPSTT